MQADVLALLPLLLLAELVIRAPVPVVVQPLPLRLLAAGAAGARALDAVQGLSFESEGVKGIGPTSVNHVGRLICGSTFGRGATAHSPA